MKGAMHYKFDDIAVECTFAQTHADQIESVQLREFNDKESEIGEAFPATQTNEFPGDVVRSPFPYGPLRRLLLPSEQISED